MTNPLGYDCDYCGACCKKLIIEADALDALREPQLLQIRPKPTIEQLLEDDGMAILLYGDHGCPFLTTENRCSIYTTRPNCCVSVLAGDAKCQQARALDGLAPLQPTGKPMISVSDWNQQYGLELTHNDNGSTQEANTAANQ